MSALLKAKDVKERLDCGLATVYALVASGALKAVVLKQGKRKPMLRFRPEAVEAFIQAHERKTDRASTEAAA